MTQHKEKWAIFPGTFDPFTNGHLDIIRRVLEIFDGIKIAVLNNATKNCIFSVEERVKLIEQELASFGGQIQVKSFSGLLVEFAKHEHSRVIIRGLRAISDYDYEAQMALMNKNLFPEIETLFLIAREDYSYVSSSIVKQAATLGGDVSRFLSPAILKALLDKVKSEAQG